MSSDECWLDFRYQFIETGWFDYDRRKTIEAMRKLSERVPVDVLDNLPSLTVFAPSAAKLGEVFPRGAGDSIFVYLSPRLERKSQAEVDFTVAHEFAHVVLRDAGSTIPPGMVVRNHGDAPSEKAADRLAESWGFAHPKTRRVSRKRGHDEPKK